MMKTISSYEEYEQTFKRRLYRIAFIFGTFMCSTYFYLNIQRGDLLDASSNVLVVTLSLIGLVLLKINTSLWKIQTIIAICHVSLYIASFLGSPSIPDAATLFWCMLFLSTLIITLGHIRSLPVLLILFTFSYYKFYVEPHSWMNVDYSAEEKLTFIIASFLLCAAILYSEYTRYKLLIDSYQEIVEKDKMKFLSTHDELTGLLNRRGFNDALKTSLPFGKRGTDKYALILIDIDNFKYINDTYGHSFGDLILKNIAKLQQVFVRSSDLVTRWGGEEFLILLENIPNDEVLRIAENIRKNVEKTPFANESFKINVTISLGISYSEEMDSFDTLLNLADERLYIAKAQNKNCIVDS